jgi:transglutaminase-like putative cysteine protease
MKTALLITILSFALPAQARWLTLSESPSVVEKLHMAFDVKKDGTWTQEVDYLATVQSEDAKVHSSIFTVEFNSATDKVDVLEAFTQNGSQKFPVPQSAMESRDKGDSRDYDAMKVLSVVYPQVQVGSKLYIRYRMRTEKPLVKDRWSTQLSFTPSVHVRDMKVRVKSELPLFFETQDSRKLLKVSQSGPGTVEVKNVKPLPGWIHAEKDPFFHPSGNAEVWITTEKDWNKFLAGLEGDYGKILKAEVPSKLAPWLAEAAKLKTPEEKVRFILEKMSAAFRYFGDWRRHDGGLVPRALKEIESSRYGDCKDLSVLLASLLRALQMDAQVALIRRGDNPWGAEPDYKIPATNRFNHAIVHVKTGNQSYWLDPTNPVTSLTAYPDISGRPAWLMGTPGRFERIPEARPMDFQHVHDYAYRFNSDDEVKVQVRASLKQLAPYRIANELLLTSKSEVLSNTLEYFSEGQEVHAFDYKKEPSTGRSLKDMNIDLDYVAGKVAYNAGSALFWVIPDGFLEGAFYETDDRESDLRLSETPFSFRGTRRLVNTKLAQSAPAACRIESAWMNLVRKIRTEGADVVIEQEVELKRPYVTRSEYRSKDFKRLQSDAKKCFHRAGVLIAPLKRTLSSNAG